MPSNVTTGQIIDAADKVHTTMGPGLLESADEVAHDSRAED
jgi:hypothetical protein